MPLDYVAFQQGIFGTSGFGKTTLLHHLAVSRNVDFIFAFDPKAQLAELFQAPWTRRWGNIGAAVASGMVFYEGRDMGQPEAAFAAFCEQVYRVCHALPGRKILLVEEIQSVLSLNKIPGGLRDVVDQGRHPKLELAFTCQWLNQLHNYLRAQMTHIAVFNHAMEMNAGELLSLGFQMKHLRSLGKGQHLARQLKPLGKIYACDAQTGVRTELAGQSEPIDPEIARIFGKSRKATR